MKLYADAANRGFAGKQAEYLLTTVKGSDNDILWTEMQNLGWMLEDPLRMKLPDNLPPLPRPMTCYAVSEQGYDAIVHLLKVA